MLPTQRIKQLGKSVIPVSSGFHSKHQKNKLEQQIEVRVKLHFNNGLYVWIGVTTIAIGKSYGVGRIGLQIEDAKFSEDFEVVYVSSSCSLLVVDRGNQAIREIQLNFDDCADQYGARLSLGRASIAKCHLFLFSQCSMCKYSSIHDIDMVGLGGFGFDKMTW